MSERGVFAVDRGIWDHPVFESGEPFSKREAWLWLISEAAWKPHRRTINSTTISVERGQVVASVRFLAEQWGWSKSAVDRFLSQLRGLVARRGRPRKSEKIGENSEPLIRTESGTGILAITICNYDKYQRVSLPSGTRSGTGVGTAAGQQRDKEEDKEDKKEDSELRSDAGASPVYADSKHELWGEGVPILQSLGCKNPRPIIGRWLRDAKDDAQKVLGAIQRARDARVIDPVPWITRSISTEANTDGRRNERLPQKAGLVAAGERLLAQLDGAAGGCGPEGGGGESPLGDVAGYSPIRLLPQRRSG